MIPLLANQNEDLESIELFNKEMADMYMAFFKGSQKSFKDDVWEEPRSSDSSLKIKLDFSEFETLQLRFSEAITIKVCDNKTVKLTPCGLAKWLFLKIKSSDSVSYRASWYLDNLKMLFRFLSDNHLASLTVEDLQSYFGLLLTHDYKNNEFVRRYSSPAYSSRLKWVHLVEMSAVLRIYQIDPFIKSISKAELNENLNKACRRQMDMTLADYQTGSTFDYLGLDIAKHYIDYCASFYEENLVFATALTQALNKMNLDLHKGSSDSPWEDLLCSKNSVNNEIFCNHVAKFLKKNANSIVAFRQEVLDEIADKLGLEVNALDTHEFIRALMFARFYEQHTKSRTAIFEEFRSSFSDELICSEPESNINFKNLSLEGFDRIVDEVIKTNKGDLPLKRRNINNRLKSLSISNRLDLNRFIQDVEAAGVTTLVSYTGYRASEYGFPKNSIKTEPNFEIRDVAYTPFRFFLEWVVPKTCGELIIKREITLSCTILTYQLTELTKFEENGFALFSKGKLTSVEASKIVYNLVNRLWLEFPERYSIFKELDVVENKDTSNPQYNNLIEKYDLKLSFVKELLALKKKLRYHCAIRKLSMRSYTGENGSTVRFLRTLELFIKGKLENQDKELLEQKLGPATIAKIREPDFVLSKETADAVRTEFIADTHYATPHALRHVWAEAVLQRYKGNVGKRIRSNFKHMDNRFFNTYINGKEVRAIMDMAKLTTINSIVRYWINKIQDQKDQYYSGFQKFIQKALYGTKTDAERSKLIEIISDTRVVDLNSLPTNDCLLRIGTFSNAKCSHGGKPKPHLAKPSFCLGCVNANFEASHYDGTMAYIKQDLDILRDKGLPFWLKEESLGTVTKALKRIEELNRANQIYGKAISYLQQSIEIARSNGAC